MDPFWKTVACYDYGKDGIEWEQKCTHEEHLSVLEFKKKERAKEVAGLETEKAEAEIQKGKAVNEAECASKKAAQVKKELQEIASLVNNV